MDAESELMTAFEKQGLRYPPLLVHFMEESSRGLQGKEARFAIYSAMSNQILNVEKTVPRSGPKCVLVYPEAVLEYIRKLRGGEVKGGCGRGKITVSLHAFSLMEWRTSAGF